MSERQKTERETSLLRRHKFTMISIFIYVIAALLLVLPTVFLAFGVQALGAAAGWWHGDPNSNDGEEVFGTLIGGAAVLIVLMSAAAIVGTLAKRYRRQATVVISSGTLALIAATCGFCMWAVASAA